MNEKKVICPVCNLEITESQNTANPYILNSELLTHFHCAEEALEQEFEENQDDEEYIENRNSELNSKAEYAIDEKRHIKIDEILEDDELNEDEKQMNIENINEYFDKEIEKLNPADNFDEELTEDDSLD